MKKLVSVLFALLLIGSTAFAEVKVGAWGRLTLVPAAALSGDVPDAIKDLGLADLTKAFAFAGPGWGDAGGMNTGFAVSASSDNAGFAIDLDVSNGKAIGFGDQAKAWIKFNDMVTLQFGMIQGDVLRGKIDDSGFLGSLPKVKLTIAGEAVELPLTQTTIGKNDIFPRFYPKAGALLDVTPAEGVYLGAAIDTPQTVPATTIATEDMFKAIQVGGGYVIPNIGHLRAQYVGGVDTDTTKAPKYFDVAFAYTGMEGLVVDTGLKYQTESEMGQSTIASGASYTKDALSAVVRVMYGFGEATIDGEVVDDPLYQASADLGYKVADPLTVGAEVSYKKYGDPTGLTVCPYGKLDYAGGLLKVGFAYSSFTKVMGDDGYSVWAIPLMMQYSF